MKYLCKKILYLFALVPLLSSCESGSYQGPLSDHFNGKVFNNTDSYQRKTILDTFRWLISRNRPAEPSYQTIKKTAQITPTLIPNEVKITFINHTSLLIQAVNFNCLTDPIWSTRASPFSFIGPKRFSDAGIKFNDLPPIDVVLISHNHYDHMDIATLQRLNNYFHPIFLVPLGNKNFLEQAGLQNVVELDWWQQYKIKDAVITFLPAKHWSARWLHDRFWTLWGSFGIDVAKKKIYFAGDTGYGKHFTEIKKKWGTPQIALLPIGAYEPRWFMRENHLSPDDAILALQDLHAKYGMGIHIGTFLLGDDGAMKPIVDLATARQKYQISNKQFFILKNGENFILK